jgi:hypothetical protein
MVSDDERRLIAARARLAAQAASDLGGMLLGSLAALLAVARTGSRWREWRRANS